MANEIQNIDEIVAAWRRTVSYPTAPTKERCAELIAKLKDREAQMIAAVEEAVCKEVATVLDEMGKRKLASVIERLRPANALGRAIQHAIEADRKQREPQLWAEAMEQAKQTEVEAWLKGASEQGHDSLCERDEISDHSHCSCKQRRIDEMRKCLTAAKEQKHE